MKSLRLKDNNGEWVTAGDLIEFSYGIPPVRVIGAVHEHNGNLWIQVKGNHIPKRTSLRSLRRFVGAWYKLYSRNQ